MANMDLHAMELMENKIMIKVHVKGLNEFRIRWSIAEVLILFAAWLAKFKVEFVELENDG